VSTPSHATILTGQSLTSLNVPATLATAGSPKATRAPVSAAPRQRRKEARPLELLDAALDVFAEKGFAAARTDDVAARAGVSKGTLYLYYPSKEALLVAVIRQSVLSDLAEAQQALKTHKGPTADLLLGLVAERFEHMLDSRICDVIKLMVTEGFNIPAVARMYVHEVIQPTHALLGAMIERGIARREFRRVHVSNTVHSIVLPMVMMCLQKHTVNAHADACPALASSSFVRDHITLVLNGIRRASSASAPSTRPTRTSRPSRP
jgi:AcrR family transcriptional regulator